MRTDFRTKADSEWTYYVVDYLPTMNKLYRFDTVEEAIAKFKELPATAISAIGSSIHSTHEIDHIHRRNGNAVLVTDSDRMSSSIWRDSQEIQSAIDKMIVSLDVKYELSSDVFGSRYPSIAIPLERYNIKNMDRYFEDKILYSSQHNRPLRAVNEVFTVGEGWVKCEDFLNQLDDCRPKMDGKGAKTLFVDRLNIRYVNQSGHTGQADISPHDYCLLKEKSKRYMPIYSSDQTKSLSDFIREANLRSNRSHNSTQTGNKHMEFDEFSM